MIKSCITYAEIKKDIEPLHLKELVRTPSEAKVANKKREITAPTVDEINCYLSVQTVRSFHLL